MQAVVQKLEFKKIINRHYIKVELIDENGVRRYIDNPLLSDDINFRKLVFGILSACGSYDLMKLATDDPEPRNMIGYYQNGLRILENENGEWLQVNKETGIYGCKKSNKETRKIIDMLIEHDMLNGYKEEGVIEEIVSRSGTFNLLFICKSGVTFFVTNQIYYGFGYPLSSRKGANPSDTALSAKIFTSFIESLMKLYGVNDLLGFGGKTDKLPIVEIELNKDNKISTITNPTTGLGLAIGAGYEIVNVNELGEQRREQSYGKK